MSHPNDNKSLGAVGWECHARQAGPLDLEEIAAVIAAEVRRRDGDKVKGLEVENINLNSKMHNQGIRNKEYAQFVRRLLNESEKLRTDLSAWQGQAQAAQKKVAELELEIEKLNRDAAIRYGEKLGAEQKVVEINAELEHLREIGFKYQTRHTKHQAENERLVNCITDKYKAIEESDAEIERLKSELLKWTTSLDAETEQLRVDLNTARNALDNLKAGFGSIVNTDDITNLRAARERLKVVNKEITNEIEAMRTYSHLQNVTISAQQTSIGELRAEAKNRPNAKLEEFTLAAMKGLLANPEHASRTATQTTAWAIEQAKSTLAELAKEGEE